MHYGLIAESSIPTQMRARHELLIGLPPLIFTAASVVLAFAISP